MEWINWFAKPHKTVVEDVEDGRRNDYVVITFPKHQRLTPNELRSKSNNITYMLLQSGFQAFLVCGKHLLTPCKEHDYKHYRSYQAIEIGVPLCEKGRLLEFLHSLSFDFEEDCVMTKCHSRIDALSSATFNAVFSTSRSRKHSHFYLYNSEYTIANWLTLTEQIVERMIRLSNELYALPKTSVETILVYDLDEASTDTYLELMMRFRDVRTIYHVLSHVCQLAYDRYMVHTPKSIPLRFLSDEENFRGKISKEDK